MSNATKVSSCATTSCAFNHEGCTAVAITVAGTGSCGTFITLDARGGLATPDGKVGACHRLECTHNKDLLCTNESISIVGDTAQCADYEVA
ncbi:DUF1540 domain-containing protein [Corynebacterium sp. H128]|uniref:DUF1540 domain-containing protein n=1 Tax=unclassified Corynebacterium TaxID=2624378 RepID=UPI0030AFA012